MTLGRRSETKSKIKEIELNEVTVDAEAASDKSALKPAAAQQPEKPAKAPATPAVKSAKGGEPARAPGVMDHAATKIQAAFRGKVVRKNSDLGKGKTPAAPTAAPTPSAKPAVKLAK